MVFLSSAILDHFIPVCESLTEHLITDSEHLGRFPFTKNFRKFRWKFPSGEKRVPFNSGPFAAQ